MGKFELEIEPVFDFELLAIVSALPDYRLCWLLNQQFKTSLVKSEKQLSQFNQKLNTQHNYTLFSEINPSENGLTLHLICNKIEGRVFLAEFKQVDYLLMLKNATKVEKEAILSFLKTNLHIITSFEIEVENLKAKEQLLF